MQKRQSHEIIIQICLQQYELFTDEIQILDNRGGSLDPQTEKLRNKLLHFIT